MEESGEKKREVMRTLFIAAISTFFCVSQALAQGVVQERDDLQYRSPAEAKARSDPRHIRVPLTDPLGGGVRQTVPIFRDPAVPESVPPFCLETDGGLASPDTIRDVCPLKAPASQQLNGRPQ